MEYKFSVVVGTRRELVQALEDELRKQNTKLQMDYEHERDVKKEAILKRNNLTIEQVDDIANKLTNSKEVSFYFDNGQEDQDFEDDGFLHVRRNGIRFSKEGHESQLQGFARSVDKAIKLVKEKR